MKRTDQMGITSSFPDSPQRIVSLVPSQTELLADLGLEEEVLGITKFCTHPERWYRSKTRIGGTKQLKIERIKKLQPDLVIGNKEENDRTQIEILRQDFPVWMSDIYTLSQALEMIKEVGELVNRAERAIQIATDIQTRFDALGSPQKALKVAYLIWRKPYMLAASNTFINNMLQWAGFQNAFAHLSRYPEVSEIDLQKAAPDKLLLSSEPFPFSDKHIEELQLICPSADIRLVDGTYFSWYGSRLLGAPGYFEELRN